MHRSGIMRMVRTPVVALTAGVLLPGCSTPQHTNTLIFGTSTRLALDVSQEPTGALGATIGYKRHEAVWMPLLANAAVGIPTTPAECTSDDCRKFTGETGAGGGAAGPGAKDTYSVLATFSGDMSGTAQGAQAKAGVAQYFATGIAARLLAQYGGAAAVSTAASSPSDKSIEAAKPSKEAIAAATKLVSVHEKKVGTIGARLSKTDGLLVQAIVEEVLGRAPAKSLDEQSITTLKQFKLRADLEAYLLDAPEDVADKIFKSLDMP